MTTPESLQILTAIEQSGVDWSSLGLAILYLLLAMILLVLELFVVSFGALLLCSITAAGAAIYYAFEANDLAGWIVTATTPLLGAMLARWGLMRIRSSRHMVVRSEIAAEAGYHHVLDGLGISIGSSGTMVTPAHPSGRARFAGGECDVQTRSGSLERGERIVVREIDGPHVFVARVHAETTVQ